MTAIAFQYIIFDQLPNVPYLTLLHKYIIASFLFISLVAMETTFISLNIFGINDWAKDVDFDGIGLIAFIIIFGLYNLYFFVKASYKRHFESKKLYMDSEQLKEYVEETKHQFKMKWFKDKNDIMFGGKNNRIAQFIDKDPILSKQEESIKNINNFCQFLCNQFGKLLCNILCKCKVCQWFCCQKKSKKSKKLDDNDWE